MQNLHGQVLAQLGVLRTGEDTEKSSNLCSFTDQMLAQLAVLRNLLVNEVYLLPKGPDEKMARLHLPLHVQCSPDAQAGKCMVHKLMDARCSFCGVPG